ncbi:hypothetical protein ABZ606_31110 [Streptomyces sp. NPDC012461]|uniref:hypothetical protein n=1 Tax=Streptomyces sp. NPDC012461 TaxID=3155117 RepID=UPI0033DF1697
MASRATPSARLSVSSSPYDAAEVDLPPLVVRDLIAQIAADWPGVLTKAWLVSPLSGVTPVYGDENDLGW